MKKVYDFFSKILSDLKIFYDLFKKENVFKYFFVILLLTIIAAVLFLFMEQDRIIASIPVKDPNFADKLIASFYWAVVTIATLGYGDIVPATPFGRIMVSIYIYLSVATMALFTANLASVLTTKKIMEKRGIMDLSNFNDHFIICGWKISMNKILSEIFSNNPKIDLNKIIIIANVEADAIELFKQQYPEYDRINIIRGEHYNETLLRKANILKARKVMLIADESNPSSSPTEADSKTIMAAMTIRTISMNIKICAELMDVKFEKYLQSVHVDDIIFTNEYSKVLIANSITGVGITKVINDLLNVNSPSFITTQEIPKQFINRKYIELKDHLKKIDLMLIGLLENVGGYVERKNESIREAQKTADVSRLIDNLKVAKKLENNLPKISPDDDYVIPKNSMAILIGRKKD
jgi:voltage-gated potassium channel